MELYKDLNSVAYLSLQECLARGVDILGCCQNQFEE